MSSHRLNKDSLTTDSAAKKPSSAKVVYRNLSASSSTSLSNFLDWDSPSHKTGTVKRRPLSSSDCSVEDEPNLSRVLQLRNRFGQGDSKTIKTDVKDKQKQTFIPKIVVQQKGFKRKGSSCSSEWPRSQSVSAVTDKNIVLTVALTPSPYAISTAISSETTQQRTKTTVRVGFNADATSTPVIKSSLGARHRAFIASDKSAEAILAASDDGIAVADEDSSYRAHTGCSFNGGAKCISDTDSGIASPLSPSSIGSGGGGGGGGFGNSLDTYTTFEYIQRAAADNNVNRRIIPKCQRKGCRCELEQIQIYTDWANHYLEKGRSKKRVNSLAADCSDGVLLADVIESVTCQKIPDINRKPKTPAQMLDNINLCLNTLKAQHVAGVDAVSGQDLRDGRLKAILALFFALSRHKQAVKQRNQASATAVQQQQQADMTPNRSTSLATHPKSTNPASSIPLPGSALPSRRCPPSAGMDKVRPITNNALVTVASGPSSRAPSPAVSMIPQRGGSATVVTSIPNGIPNGVGSPYYQPVLQGGQQVQLVVGGTTGHQGKGSMLDKLRLFKSGDGAGGGIMRQQTSCGKRTSSSSGVSSARSERSDSSISLDVISPGIVDNTKVRSTSKLKPHKISTSTSTGNVKSNTAVNGGVNTKSSPNVSKKETGKNVQVGGGGGGNIITEVERHGQKVAQIQNQVAASNKPFHTPQIKLSKSNLHHHHQQQQQDVAIITRHNSQQQILCTSTSSVALSSSNITVNASGGTGIPKPTAAIKGTAVVVKVDRNRTGISRENTQMSMNVSKPTIGVVSPMKSDSQLSESNHSISTIAQNSDLSDNAATELHIKLNEQQKQHINNEISMKDQLNSSNETKTKYNDKDTSSEHHHLTNTSASISTSISLTPIPTTSTSRTSIIPASQSISTTANHVINNNNSGYNASSSHHVPPMRPLFRPHHYTATGATTCTINSGTVPGAFNYRVQPDGGSDYCDVMISSGYMSDGEILRYPGSVGRAQQMHMLQYGSMLQSGSQMGYSGMLGGMDYADPCSDGYMSEGGIGLYTKRQQSQQHYAGLNGGTDRNPFNSITSSAISVSSSSSPSSTSVLTDQSARTPRGRPSHHHDDSATNPQPPPSPGPRHTPITTTTSNGRTIPPFGPPLSATAGGGNSHWKRYTDSPGVGSPPIQAVASSSNQGSNPPPPPPPAPGSPTGSGRERRSLNGGGVKEGKGGGKVRGVPQSFGYVKRGGNTNGCNNNGVPSQSGKTAQVLAVPRMKVKVSGGTQTCSSDLQPHKGNQQQQQQFKSFSLTGNAANQLSQSVRERLLLGSQSLPKGAGQEYSLVIRQARTKASDGSLSDTQAIDVSSPYAPWLRHSNTYSVAPRLSETDSMESLTSLPGHRGSLTHNRLLRDSPNRLSRSNSIRSTKSEKLYPSMLQRSAEQEQEPYYCLPVGSILNHWSQPTSPAPGSNRNFPLSPTHSIPRHSVPKNDEIHGSSVSLVSTASSLYSSAEEKHANEIRKLRRELMDAHEKVQTLTSQLNTNSHVVSAFEQSLASMNQRLQHLTATSEKKDTELSELRATLEALRTQSIQAGISNGLARQPSSDSVSSLSSACSLDKHEKKKKKGWLRSSFTKAFSRNAKVTKIPSQSETEIERDQSRQSNPPSPPPPPPIDSGPEVQELQKQLRDKDLVLTDIRLEALSSAHQLEGLKDTVMKMRSEMLSLKQNNERLQRMVNGGQELSTHLSGNLHYHNNNSNIMDPLTDLIQSADDGTADSIPLPEGEIADGKRITISVYLGQPHTFRQYYAVHYRDVDYEQQDLESIEQNRLKNGTTESGLNEISIAYTIVSATTTWPQLDNAVRRAFKTHVARLDPGGGLGLGSDSVASYTLGDAQRASDTAAPDLLPYGYVVGHVRTLQVVLQPVAALAFETLIPKGVAQRLVSLLAEHRRIVLCGAPGTGKTHLAAKLAQFHAQSVDREDKEAVVTFNIDNKSAKELRQYLAHLSEQAAAGEIRSIPCVVILDNLHKAGPLADALGSLPRNLPCLLGTMAQSACSATSLQLQHGFRWVLVAPHMEPARGLLGRVLRRRLASLELENGPQPELAAVLGWLPRVWQHLNAFLETHSSGDVVIGPRLFLSCPLELDAARAWFADIWNYSLTPYLRDAAREGLQLYGRRSAWTDPCQFIVDTYPWSGAPPQGLTNITAKDVGLESDPSSQTENDGDPLLNMLMRLQEAANYSSPHSNDSDCNSLDSNVTNNSNNTVGTESV